MSVSVCACTSVSQFVHMHRCVVISAAHFCFVGSFDVGSLALLGRPVFWAVGVLGRVPVLRFAWPHLCRLCAVAPFLDAIHVAAVPSAPPPPAATAACFCEMTVLSLDRGKAFRARSLCWGCCSLSRGIALRFAYPATSWSAWTFAHAGSSRPLPWRILPRDTNPSGCDFRVILDFHSSAVARLRLTRAL